MLIESLSFWASEKQQQQQLLHRQNELNWCYLLIIGLWYVDIK